MNIIIRNLDRNIRAEELAKMMGKFGTVTSCNIVIDEITGKSKGFGFVEMPNQKEWKAAIKSLNGKQVGREKIRVKTTKARPPKDLFSE